ncbi:nickel pincer cofactor biosynthesis protein LarC [soil metagenome]
MIGWVDATAGASGDMLLGAVVGAGVPLRVLTDAVAAVAPERIGLTCADVRRGGLAATLCSVAPEHSDTRRTWRDVAALLADAQLDAGVRTRARAAFERLAVAEASVHGTSPEDVHFHEVGALDAIADVVGVSAGLEHLGLTQLVVSPIGVGSGRVRGTHGDLPVPPPAVAELLLGVPSYAGPAGAPEMELCTPTGAALLVANATSFVPQPAMTVQQLGVGAGGRDPAGHANVVRLLVGADIAAAAESGRATMIETNVDDLDPRLWPNVIAALLDAGASDAWLTPILMKKGRPAHTLHALVPAERVDAVRTAVFRNTSTIGVRETVVAKTALERQMRSVVVDGHQIAVKLAVLDGTVVNAQPEYDDVARAAERAGTPIKDVLAAAVAATRELDQL